VRILFLAPQPFFEVRGTPLAVHAFVGALLRLGHEVELLSFPQGQDVALPGLVHRRSLRLPVGRVKAGPSLAKLLLDLPFVVQAGWRMLVGRFDVVHAVEEAAHLVAPLARLLRLPLVADVDSSIPDQLRYSGFATHGPLLWAAEALEVHALGHAAAVVTVCASLTDAVRARAPQATIFQIEDPPLVEAPGSATAAPGRTPEQLRAALGLDARPVALYTGNFEPYQGVELLVAAAGLLPEVQFLFVGGEPHEVATLRARAPVGAGCVFAGKRPPSELGDLLRACDVVVSPRCRGTNTPFKIYTYLAALRPLVATRIATHTQLLDDTLAFLVEPTAAGLAAGIRAALADPEAAQARAQRGRALIEREYSVERYEAKVAAAYTAVAAQVDAARGSLARRPK
jgi:glycosyltransferase involved in cell wall biosynthesis